ncbi:MAG: hypothetical protein WCC38_14260 [Pseudonocardiaceae bacterium]
MVTGSLGWAIAGHKQDQWYRGGAEQSFDGVAAKVGLGTLPAVDAGENGRGRGRIRLSHR